MRHLVFRLFLIIIFGFFLLSYVVPWSNYGIQVPFSGGEYKLGLDLQGGIELDYKVDLEEAKKGTDYDKEKERQIIEGLKSIIDKRVEILNINDSVITSADYAGEQHIIVQIPLKGNNSLENSENIKKAKAAIGKVVKIEFKERRTEMTEQDLNDRKILAENAVLEINETKNFSVVADKYKLTHENVIIGELVDPITMFDIKANDIVSNKIVDTKQISNNEFGYLILSEKVENIYNYIFISKTPSEWMSAKDSKGRILDDKYFVKSSVQFNQAFTPMIELTFNDEGAKIFGELSSRLVGKEMAIFVGGELLTAPTINEAILGGKAVITGNYTPEEAKALSQDINTGVVPAPIYLTSEKTIDSKLGDSSLQKMIIAGFSGFILILLFLVIVYRFAGFISAIALLMYVMLVLTVVKGLGIVLTLASVAGLILSIGMAIDANILVFERVKDELRDGKSLSEATSRGFTKSWSAIWDSNVTGLIVSLILFIFGINMIKGFGLMLAIGILVSLFSVMWISRVMLMLFADTMKSKKLFIGIKK
ncbi:MAG: protein translocase subunit SecD [Candidatus Gracilibacteria bacterium]|nr:protein translocase subunit SecD [Candidatus Gracilibacteria bacterium]